jgi:hypothetical protein
MFVAVACLAAMPARAQDPPIRETRPNVKVLKDLRESEIFLAMNFVADALGVTCEHCHVKAEGKWAWADDSKPAKAKGRQMMAMVAALNASEFDGKSRVTCYTCHRGSLEVPRLVSLPPVPTEDRAAKNAETLPTAQQLIDRYLVAIGTRGKVEAKPLHVQGEIERTEGRKDAFELWLESAEKARIRITSADGVAEQSLDGTKAWSRRGDKVTELPPPVVERMRQSFAMYAPVKVHESVEQMKVAGSEVIDGRRAYVVHVVADGAVTRRLYFDAASGFLLRDITIRETAFVPLLEQIDYSDYRDAGGVKVPFVIRTSDVAPYDTATRRLTSWRFESPAPERQR